MFRAALLPLNEGITFPNFRQALSLLIGIIRPTAQEELVKIRGLGGRFSFI
jgi:hypothetical protein